MASSSVYGIRTIDEAIELLTGLPAGVRDANGAYPPDSVNGAVERALTEFAAARREYDARGAAKTSDKAPHAHGGDRDG